MSGPDDISKRLRKRDSSEPVSIKDLAQACEAMTLEEGSAMDTKLKVLAIAQKILNSEQLSNLPEDEEMKIVRLFCLLKNLRQYHSHPRYLDSILKVLEYNLFPEEN